MTRARNCIGPWIRFKITKRGIKKREGKRYISLPVFNIPRERERERRPEGIKCIKRTDYECVVNHRCLFFASFLYTHTHKRSLVEFTRLLASTTWVIIMGEKMNSNLAERNLASQKAQPRATFPVFPLFSRVAVIFFLSGMMASFELWYSSSSGLHGTHSHRLEGLARGKMAGLSLFQKGQISALLPIGSYQMTKLYRRAMTEAEGRRTWSPTQLVESAGRDFLAPERKIHCRDSVTNGRTQFFWE